MTTTRGIAPTSMSQVTIGVPTFNRTLALERAIDSVLSQTCSDWTLIISDDASTDGTQALCERIAAQDRRIEYVRHPRNIGLTANLNFLAATASSPYFMYLADDDALASTYVAKCVEVLEGSCAVATACGTVRSVQGGRVVRERVPRRLTHPSRARRLIDFFGAPGSKAGYFYGLHRRSFMQATGPMLNYLRNDEVLMAGMAYLGSIVPLADTFYYKDRGGDASPEEIARKMGLPSFHGRHPVFTFAWNAAADIVWRSPVYREAPLWSRLILALTGIGLWALARGLQRRLLPRLHGVRSLWHRGRRVGRKLRRRGRRVRKLTRRVLRRQGRKVRRFGRRVRRIVRRVEGYTARVGRSGER
jgi:glycosyltransferase involved in cell wall biosynthesis